MLISPAINSGSFPRTTGTPGHGAAGGSNLGDELAAQWRRQAGSPPRDCKVEFGRHYVLGRIGCLASPRHRRGALKPNQARALEASYESLGIEIGLRTSRTLSAIVGRRVTGVGATYCPIVDELVIVWDLPPGDAGEPHPSIRR